MKRKVCYLQSLQNVSKRIVIHNDRTVILGRNSETGVKDAQLSRKQLECQADYGVNMITVKAMGRSYSGCNGFALKNDHVYNLKQDDILELRLGHHPFKVIFEEDEGEEDDQSKSIEEEGQQKRDTAGLQLFAIPAAKRNDAGDIGEKLKQVKGNWEKQNDLLIFTSEGCTPQKKIAAFDVDGTIIKTKSGARFPKNHLDWMINFDFIPKRLCELFSENYKIVFFTNQLGVGKDLYKIADFRTKIENVVSYIGVPMQVFVALGNSIYRKPAIGMWTALSNRQKGREIDKGQSFYVGDAAGREKNWYPRKGKDHSLVDRLFAMNIGISFFTPEEYFLKFPPAHFNTPKFDPKTIVVDKYPKFQATGKDVILMVGIQGSGKSFFCKTQLMTQGYMYVSRDKLGTWQKCLTALEEYLKQGKNVVIDNTNPDKEARRRYIEISKRHKFPCRCFVMTTTSLHAKHNLRFRELIDKDHAPINDIIVNSFKKKYEEPELSEGFTQILKIPFIPTFDNWQEEQLYKFFLLES